MNKEAVLHTTMSEYSHGISEDTFVIRIRTAKNDIKKCTLMVGDTACRKTPIDFYPEEMRVVATDLLFDYFEAEFKCPYNRIYYYFVLDDGKESVYYFNDFFREELPDDRSEYYKLPFLHRADIAYTPDWVKDAVIYNIFPDSFATGKRYISCKSGEKMFKTEKMTEEVKTVTKLGGTIKGITENADYLKDLGINCIYINPSFAAGQCHKYDTIDYFTIDPNFGTNEDFKEMVSALHANGIRVIIDGVFNHCGWMFYAFDDVVRNQEKSQYVDWFYRLSFPVERPDNGEDIPGYECFAYERLMPKLNTENPEVIEMICSVGEYWIKEFDIDGWRLDVANEINDDLWRTFRKRVKAAKKDAFIIGEVWENSRHWLQGDMFDSVMNYDVRKFSKYYFAWSKIDTKTFNAGVTNMLMRYKKDLLFGELNLLDSHDVSRFLSECNGDEKKFKDAVVFQMMFIGAPSVFYGDEKGLMGVTEPEYRRPMEFDKESDLYDFYKKIIAVRTSEAAVRRGSFECISEEGVYAFVRRLGNESVYVYINNSEKEEKITSPSKNVLMEEGYDAKSGSLLPHGFVITKETGK